MWWVYECSVIFNGLFREEHLKVSPWENAAAEEGTGTQIADDSTWSWTLNLKDWCELFSSLKADGYLLRASLSKKVRIPATCATPSPPPFPPFWSSPQDADKRHQKRKAVGHPWGSEDLIPINPGAAQGPRQWAYQNQGSLACWEMLIQNSPGNPCGDESCTQHALAHPVPHLS